MGLRETRLLRCMFSYARRPNDRAFQQTRSAPGKGCAPVLCIVMLCFFDVLIYLLVIQNVYLAVAVVIGQQAEVVLVRQLFRGAPG